MNARLIARPFFVVASLLIVIGATALMYFQPLPADPVDPPKRWSLAWWTSPTERNGFARLPLATGELTRLFVLPKTRHVWAGGAGSPLLLHSSDGGLTWEAKIVGNADVADFVFDSPKHGWVLDARGYVVETSDGGNSWAPRPLPSGDYVSLAVSGSRISPTTITCGSWRMTERSALG